jgi:RNA recognition motif-containing protein
MAKKLYVGNLSWNIGTDELRDLFAEHGEVLDAIVLADRETGRSRGFGFVEFANGEDADKAIEGMNGREVDGRALRVNEAQERKPRGHGGGGGGGGRRDNRW